jgi:hypothetical protein
MMRDILRVWVIETFEFRICFVLRASDFEFTGQAEMQRIEKPICSRLAG